MDASALSLSSAAGLAAVSASSLPSVQVQELETLSRQGPVGSKQLHDNLKAIKLGKLLVTNHGGQPINITWSEKDQLFSLAGERMRSAMGCSPASKEAGSQDIVTISAHMKSEPASVLRAAYEEDDASMAVGSVSHQEDDTSMAVVPAADRSKEATHTEIDSSPSPHSAFGDFTESDFLPTLNQLEKKDKIERRISHRTLEEQGGDEFIKELLNYHPNLSVKVVHSRTVNTLPSSSSKGATAASLSNSSSAAYDESGGMEISREEPLCFSQKAAASSSEIEGTMELQEVPFKQRPILIYGFQSSQKSMAKQLAELGFTDLRTMFTYNKGLGIGMGLPFGFNKYCEFLSKAREPVENTGVHPLVITDEVPNKADASNKANPSNFTYSPVPPTEVNKWALYVSQNVKIFNFSHNLKTQAQRIHFLQNNYTGIEDKKAYDKLPELEKNYIEEKNWTELVDHLEDAFNLLAEAGNSSCSKEGLIIGYKQLAAGQQAILDDITTYAFFRKTSKLGEHFAADQGITIVSVLKIEGKRDTEQISATNHLLEVDPTYFSPPEFRIKKLLTKGGGEDFVPKAITFSEIAEAGRMMQRMKPSDKKLRYVFLTELINPDSVLPKNKQQGRRSNVGVGSRLSASTGDGAVAAAAQISFQDDDL